MLVTPVQDDQTAVLGLGLLRRAADPPREVTTAARLNDNAQVADRVRRDLHLPDSSRAARVRRRTSAARPDEVGVTESY
jgi:hypothetical protein